MDLGAIKKGVLRIYGLIPRLRITSKTNGVSDLEGVVFDRDTSEAYKRELEEATEYFLHRARPTTKDVKVEFEWSDPKNFLLSLVYNEGKERKLPFMYVCINPKEVSKIEETRNNIPPYVMQAQDLLNQYYKERGFQIG
ncbi:hypothetical protein HYV49_05565 [Candidatus Pacearchaeota archaeon]|nr:hypothetical protein [Candidatus Pacearchaeota archaeon]